MRDLLRALRALTAGTHRQPAPIAGPPAAARALPVRDRMFNDPPIFPDDPELENPYDFASATLHIGDTTAPVETFTLEQACQPDRPKPSPDPITDEQPPPRRRGGPPTNCPCIAIYSICICPDRS